MKQYYLNNGENNSGPFNIKELKDQKITKDTPVWSNDMQNWKKAGEVDELKSILSNNPPPLKKIQKSEYQKPKKSIFLKYLIIAISIIAFLAIGSNIISENNTNQNNFIPEDDSINIQLRNNITSLVQVSTNQYSVNSFGGISNLDIIATNNTDYTIDEIKVAIAYIKKNDGVFKTEYLTFNNIQPKQNKSLSAPDSNRGLSVTLTKQSITSTDLNLCYNNSFTPAVGDPDPYKCN
jgi:GYF domain 2